MDNLTYFRGALEVNRSVDSSYSDMTNIASGASDVDDIDSASETTNTCVSVNTSGNVLEGFDKDISVVDTAKNARDCGYLNSIVDTQDCTSKLSCMDIGGVGSESVSQDSIAGTNIRKSASENAVRVPRIVVLRPTQSQHTLSSGPNRSRTRKRRVVTCILVFTFDLELGQAVEQIYPDVLSDEEKKRIAFLSFPDSTSVLGDTVFCFRTPIIDKSASSQERPQNPRSIIAEERSIPVPTEQTPAPNTRSSIKLTTARQRYHYGSVYFRQEPDNTIRRGFFQKSVVVLSQYPYIGLLNELVKVIAPKYFSRGERALQRAMDNIWEWPRVLTPGLHNLSMLNERLSVHISDETHHSSDFLISDLFKSSYAAEKQVNAMQVCTLSAHYQSMVPDMWLLWELVIIGEPIIIISDSPSSCSEAVLALVSLIAPLKYECEYRPFFTIHDAQFKEWAKSSNRPPRCILGVTNPYFNTALEHWPHVIRLSRARRRPRVAAHNGIMGSPLESISSTKGPHALTAAPGVYTDFVPTLEKDKSLLRRIANLNTELPHSLGGPTCASQRSSFGEHLVEDSTKIQNNHYGVRDESDTTKYIQILGAQNEVLRKHFYQITQSFLAPLEKYFSSLIPLQKRVLPWKPIPRLQNFNKRVFLNQLADAPTHGLILTRNADVVALYREFMACPNFDRWLRTKAKSANDALWKYYISQLEVADSSQFIANHSEIEAVDLILRLKAMCTIRNDLISENVILLLKNHADTIIKSLPEDLRQSLHTGDGRREH
eukprot:CFRG0676T1